jgi:hypothetical protein
MKPLDTLFVLIALAVSAHIASAGGPVLCCHHWSLSANVHGAVKLDLEGVQIRVAPGDKIEVAVTRHGHAEARHDLIELSRHQPDQ